MRPAHCLFVVLLMLFGVLQYRLWVGEGSFKSARELEVKIAKQHVENEKLFERNRLLEAEVLELKSGTETVEERARQELGMVKPGETLYLIIQ